jgi:hypothetical protein
MSRIQFYKIWVQQCRATRGIKRRFGVKSALEYLLGEKLMNFVNAAEQHPEFAAEYVAQAGSPRAAMEKAIQGWKVALERSHQCIADVFERWEVRERSLSYLEGVRSGCERKNSWYVAEWAGEASPFGMQYLLDRARWDADAVQARLSEYVKAPGISRSRYFTMRIPRNAPEKFLQTRAILDDSS